MSRSRSQKPNEKKTGGKKAQKIINISLLIVLFEFRRRFILFLEVKTL